MSAEHAPVEAGPGAVISLSSHPRRRSHRIDPPDFTEPEQILAEIIEALFLKRSRTLTDEDTAEAYVIAIDAMLLVIDGAMARGVVGETEHQALRGMAEGMRQAPERV
ncbi:hypothetical protein [Streptomyces sp. NPDC059076]|uniref:hypothetical protein n=1 Tax=unclassified Streptomyces TaxID=2593676 RepID=UPI0036C42951